MFHPVVSRCVFSPRLEWLLSDAPLTPWLSADACLEWLWDTLPSYTPLPHEYVPCTMVSEDLPEQQRLMTEAKFLVFIDQILAPMVELDNPLRERVALFWHHHMPSGYGRTLEHGRHHWEIFRKYGLGPLRPLLMETLSSPAMMRFLELRYSRKEDPNENFAREFMELHTLGEGHYTLDDVKEAARALTGYRYQDKPPFDLYLDDAAHDDGSKSIFGKQGNYDVNDFVDLVLQKPQTAKHISRSALRFFLADDPPESMVEDCAHPYFGSGYDFKVLLDEMFRHPIVHDKNNRLTKVKTPVEFLVTFQRQTGARTIGLKTNWQFLSRCGQLFFYPPTVAGWPGGEHWLQGDRLLNRLFLPTTLLDIANRSTPRNALEYKVASRLFNAEKRSFRYISDLKWDEQGYRDALLRNDLSETEWLLGEKDVLLGTRDILQDPRYQYC